MVVVVKKPLTASKLEEALEKIVRARKKRKKGFDAKKFAAKINWKGDALTIQKKMLRPGRAQEINEPQ